MGFTDLHNHILPGLDDGPATAEETLELLRKATDHGTTLMVATPHGLGRAYWQEIAQLHEAHASLREALRAEEIELSLALGMEVPLEVDIVSALEEGRALTLNDTSYVLVELPFTNLPPGWDTALFQLQIAGYRPVIAHPERQAQIQANSQILRDIVDRGILAQITAGSILGLFGREAKAASETLLKNSLIHIIASDAHEAKGPREPRLEEAAHAATRFVGHDRAIAMISTTPQAIVEGQDVNALL